MAYDLLDLEMVRMIFDILHFGWAYNDLASSHIRRLIQYANAVIQYSEYDI